MERRADGKKQDCNLLLIFLGLDFTTSKLLFVKKKKKNLLSFIYLLNIFSAIKIDKQKRITQQTKRKSISSTFITDNKN